jgi:hypothetical protein
MTAPATGPPDSQAKPISGFCRLLPRGTAPSPATRAFSASNVEAVLGLATDTSLDEATQPYDAAFCGPVPSIGVTDV